MSFAKAAALKLCPAPLAHTCCRQDSISTRRCPAHPHVPCIKHHTHKVHLCFRAGLRPTHLSQHHLGRWEHFLWLIPHLLHTTLLLFLSLHHRLHLPAKGTLIACMKLTIGCPLTSTRAGINIDTVLGFYIYCWYGRMLKSNFYSWRGLFNPIFVLSVAIQEIQLSVEVEQSPKISCTELWHFSQNTPFSPFSCLIYTVILSSLPAECHPWEL